MKPYSIVGGRCRRDAAVPPEWRGDFSKGGEEKRDAAVPFFEEPLCCNCLFCAKGPAMSKPPLGNRANLIGEDSGSRSPVRVCEKTLQPTPVLCLVYSRALPIWLLCLRSTFPGANIPPATFGWGRRTVQEALRRSMQTSTKSWTADSISRTTTSRTTTSCTKTSSTKTSSTTTICTFRGRMMGAAPGDIPMLT